MVIINVCIGCTLTSVQYCITKSHFLKRCSGFLKKVRRKALQQTKVDKHFALLKTAECPPPLSDHVQIDDKVRILLYQSYLDTHVVHIP